MYQDQYLTSSGSGFYNPRRTLNNSIEQLQEIAEQQQEERSQDLRRPSQINDDNFEPRTQAHEHIIEEENETVENTLGG
jgi:hypothetical protein